MRVLILASLLVCSFGSQAQLLSQPKRPAAVTELDNQLATVKEPSEVMRIALGFRKSGDLDSEARAWRRMATLRPHLGQYRYDMAAAFAALDRKSEAYSALLELQGQGYAFKPEADPRFKPIATTEAWEFIVKGLEVNRQPFGEGAVQVTLPAEDLLVESIAWDAKRKKVLVGGAREGTVSIVRPDGSLQDLVRADDENGMWAVFDVVVDAKRNLLWVASTAVPHFKRYDAERDLGRAGLFKFNLKTGKFIKRFLSPTVPGQSFFMSSLALSPDGTVFAADGVNNAVYLVRDDQLTRLFHAPILGSLRGMAVSGDSKILYFSDFERGLFGFDLVAGKPFEVLPGPKLALGGIEGIAWWRGQLAFVQGGMNPPRVMRIKLSDDGRSVVGVQPLEANRPELPRPTAVSLDDDRLLLLGNSQKGVYDRFGLPRSRDALEGQVVFATDLNFGKTQSAQPD